MRGNIKERLTEGHLPIVMFLIKGLQIYQKFLYVSTTEKKNWYFFCSSLDFS